MKQSIVPKLLFFGCWYKTIQNRKHEQEGWERFYSVIYYLLVMAKLNKIVYIYNIAFLYKRLTQSKKCATMNSLTKQLLEADTYEPFSLSMLKKRVLDKTELDVLLLDALARREIIRIYRNWFMLERSFFSQEKRPIERFALANKMCSPSYISLEMLLRIHDFIPEAVFTVTSVSTRHHKDIFSELGMFSYDVIPQRNIFAGVYTVKYGYTTHLQATPLKALADYIYVCNLNWTTLEPLRESLRIEDESLETITAQDFNEIQENYPECPNVENFLCGIRKELGL